MLHLHLLLCIDLRAVLVLRLLVVHGLHRRRVAEPTTAHDEWRTAWRLHVQSASTTTSSWVDHHWHHRHRRWHKHHRTRRAECSREWRIVAGDAAITTSSTTASRVLVVVSVAAVVWCAAVRDQGAIATVLRSTAGISTRGGTGPAAVALVVWRWQRWRHVLAVVASSVAALLVVEVAAASSRSEAVASAAASSAKAAAVG